MTRKTYHAFSKKALNYPTPTLAKNIFRITFCVTSALALFMAATQLIDENWKFEVLLGLKAIDGLVLGLSKMFGVEVENVTT